MGSIIGHEISHTFNPEGSAFDSTGRVRNWWKPANLAHFNAATAGLAAQYDTYKPFPDLAVMVSRRLMKTSSTSPASPPLTMRTALPWRARPLPSKTVSQATSSSSLALHRAGHQSRVKLTFGIK